MSENAEAGTGNVIPGEQLPPQRDDTSSDPAGQDYAPEVISEAKRTGWRPIEEFKGDPDRWTPPDAWVQRAKDVLPIAAAANKKLSGQVDALEQRIAAKESEFEERIARMQRMHEDAISRSRQSIINRAEAAKEAAAERGDAAAIRQIEAAKQEQLSETLEQEKVLRAPVEKKPVAPKVPEVVTQWAERNPWFMTDEALHTAAVAHDKFLKRTKPGLTVEEHLDAVEKHVKRAYPDAFGASTETDDEDDDEPAPVRRSAVASGTRSAGNGGQVQGALARKLPAEAKAAAQRCIAEGLYKNVDEYAKVYFDQPGA